MAAERTESFDKLRPVCVKLTKEQTRESVQELFDGIRSVPADVLQDLQEYVLFPLRFTIKHQTQDTLKEDVLAAVCACVGHVLSHTAVTRWEMFQDMFTSFTSLLVAPDNGQGRAISSDELKLGVVQVLGTLLKSADETVVRCLFSAYSLPAVGYAVSVLLRLGETDKCRDVQLAAMETLLCLSHADSTSGLKARVIYGNLFASFLPGITISLCRIATGDTKQGHAVLCRAVELWTKVVCLVLEDSQLEESQEQNEVRDDLDERLRGLVVRRLPEWVKVTASKMLVLVRQMASLTSHPNWRVRNALVDWADRLLHRCTKSLSESGPVFLEVLVGMIGDEYSAVADRSRRVLETYKTRQTSTENAQPLTAVLEENLHILVLSLPRQIRVADEDQKLCAINLLAGYLDLLGPSIRGVLRSQPHLHHLALALLQTMELDCSSVSIVEQRTSMPGYGSGVMDSDHPAGRPRNVFKHFQDHRIADSLMKTCRLLGYHGDLSILVDHFLDIVNESARYRMSATLILNEIVFGHTPRSEHKRGGLVEAAGLEQGELDSTVRMLVEEYLSPANFNLQTVTEPDPSPLSILHPPPAASPTTASPTTVVSLNQNICQVCLYMEGVARFASVLAPRFRPLLMLVLYPLLDKLGDDNSLISSTAYSVLVALCQACEYRSLDEMIRHNADYLMNAISLRLRHLEANLRCPTVLRVMLQYSEADILPLVDDTVQEILSCLDDHYIEEAAIFVKVLHELVKAINRWFPWKQKAAQHTVPTDPDPDDQEVNHPPQQSTSDSIRDFFLDYHRQRVIADCDVREEEYADVAADNVDDVEKEEADIDLPKHVSAVKEVLQRTKHLLASSAPRLRLLVLDVISQAVIALRDWRNELLPLVHQLWQPFSLRFTDGEKLVTIKAIQTLATMCKCCEDFLRQRIAKDVVPKLVSFLTTQEKISCSSAQAYQYTLCYKLQLSCLTHLGPICHEVEARGLDLVVQGCLPYLSAQQPKPLQQASLTCFQHLIDLEPDVIWLRLSDLYTPDDPSPPGSEFRKVQFLTRPGERNEYSDNVALLLPLTSCAHTLIKSGHS
ncbi:TELO2-interacting protein 1 homolog isoform X1 [Haliotis rufescens]|uniref:TELO2-interacting protein 1 homolog isoform X1 n=1 Tax=Haliotis rufescens TaxID=6454 RepID=UPI00201EE026|nr:TELO2-interacting protein 1 homolog isoform X1 [Haliotis rufescens]XP_048249154.1 TELO2-interacting protein 1 homolog isoform X1 [Haliotis rufescens]